MANATVGCVGNTCTITACDTGNANCNGDESDGCEVNTTDEAGNCAGCGKVCALGAEVVSEACSASACHVQTCVAGYGDCDHLNANGCEVDLLDDPSNCGACASPCGGLCQDGSCCLPASAATTCAGKCGTVLDNCGQPVACPGCTLPETCGGGGMPGVCALPVGTVPWSELFSGSMANQNPYAEGLAVDLTGNAIVVGTYYGDLNFGCGELGNAGLLDMYLAKLDGAGHCTWAKTYGDPNEQQGQAVTSDPSGNIYATGYYGGTVDFGCGAHTANTESAFVVKLSPAGACLWSKQFDTTSYGSGIALGLDAAGNIYVDGNLSAPMDLGCGTLTPLGFNDAFLAKLDPSGSCLWSKDWGPPVGNANAIVNVNALAVAPSGNVVAAGTYYKTTLNLGGATFASEPEQTIFVAEVAPTGALVWSEAFPTGSYQVPDALLVDGSGDVFLTGLFQGTVNFGSGAITAGGINDGFLAEFGPTGTNVWTRHMIGANQAGINGAGLAFDGADILVGGSFSRSADFGGGPVVVTDNEVFLAKYTTAGAYVSVRHWGTGGGGFLALDPSGNAFLFGTSPTTINFGQGVLAVKGGASSDNLFLAKLVP